MKLFERSRPTHAVLVAAARPVRVIRVQWREVFVVVGILIVTAALVGIALRAGGWLDERDSAQGSLADAGEVIATQQDRLTDAGQAPVAVPTGVASAITEAASSASSPVPSLVTVTERGPAGVVITRTITATTTLPGLPATTVTLREVVTDSRTTTTTLPAPLPPPPVVVTTTTTSTAPGAPPVTVTTTETLPAPPPVVVTVTESSTVTETTTLPPPPETVTVTVTPDPPTPEQTDQPTDQPTDGPTTQP